ncbi:hypothetical protein G6321_00049775 [Bradyrhizobium barranii subsp. barranii]|uniref:Uncharacterized protein n=1 Tax=Bradyrhizobium barranii subsp. barranii TaxID=2823807 RepID=A0A7Z0QCM2_9BRAD|nr:hypothetical protein [Bradyrhizobium barranii]UGX93598.1 hypothetical protein G6321_00049775 [Bradyrhizobium barranii subsp. barranii]
MHGLFVRLAGKRQTARSRDADAPFCCALARSNGSIAMQHKAQHFAAEAASPGHQMVSQRQALRKDINNFRKSRFSFRPIAMLHFFRSKAAQKKKRAPEGAL